MTDHCIKCGRALKNPSQDGYGPVCRKAVTPIPDHGRDLFGFDIAAAAESARLRMVWSIAWSALDAKVAVRDAFAAARRRLGVAA